MRGFGLILLTFAAFASAGTAGAAELVGPQELQSRWFDGKSIATVGPRGGKSDLAFSRDGKIQRTGGRAGSPGDGTWRLDDDGFCMKLGQAKQESCYLALRQQDGSLRVMRRSGGAFAWTR
ncbi:MAG: hypothetical protein ABW275_04595 [Hansschlegelia sp.]